MNEQKIKEIFTKIKMVRAWLHSKQGKAFLAYTWPMIKKHVPKRAWIEAQYWKFDDPKTGDDEEMPADNVDYDTGLPAMPVGKSLPDYSEALHASKRDGLIFPARRQSKDTCGWDTINNAIGLMCLYNKIPLASNRLIGIEAGYQHYKSRVGGTNTSAVYPKLIRGGVPTDLLGLIEGWENTDPRLVEAMNHNVNYFNATTASRYINRAQTNVDKLFAWVDKCKVEADTMGKMSMMSFSKHNMRGVPTYGITVPKILKGKELKRTGGHITAIDISFGVFMYKGQRAIRVIESSYPRGGDNYHIYTEDVIKVIGNKFQVMEFAPEFWTTNKRKVDFSVAQKQATPTQSTFNPNPSDGQIVKMVNLMKPVGFGQYNDSVRFLQKILKHLGFSIPETGKYDTNTQAAVVQFQKLHQPLFETVNPAYGRTPAVVASGRGQRFYNDSIKVLRILVTQ